MDFQGPCPVHPVPSHTWGDCFNNPNDTTNEGQNSNNCNLESHSGCRYYFSTRGQGCGHGHRHGCGHGSYNAPCLPNPFITLYIQQAPTNDPPDELSTVTNTDTSTVAPTQTYVVKHMNNNRGEKIADGYTTMLFTAKQFTLIIYIAVKQLLMQKIMPAWHCHVQILILIISTHIYIHRMKI